MPTVATAKTIAGQNRQVAMGKFDVTSQGLRAGDLVQSKSGRWVRKNRSEKKLNAYMELAIDARRRNLESFTYKDNVYRRATTSTGMTVYKKET